MALARKNIVSGVGGTRISMDVETAITLACTVETRGFTVWAAKPSIHVATCDVYQTKLHRVR